MFGFTRPQVLELFGAGQRGAATQRGVAAGKGRDPASNHT